MISPRVNIGKEIAELFELNPSEIKKIDLHVSPGNIVEAEVMMYLPEEKKGGLLSILRRYKIVPLEDCPSDNRK